MEFRIQSEGWGFCLFSLNVSPQILSLYHDPPNGSPLNLLETLHEKIGPTNSMCQYNLFGVHDLIWIFKRSPQQEKEESRHSVIQHIAEWSGQVTQLKNLQSAELSTINDTIWNEHLKRSLRLSDTHCRDLSTYIKSQRGSSPFKVPSLYNYTHDALIPLYFSQSDPHQKLLKHQLLDNSRGIVAFCFLRIDPRVMRICSAVKPGQPDCWGAYQKVLEQIEDKAKNIVAVWSGLGMSQLILMISATSFLELTQIISSFRNNTKININGSRQTPYSLVTTSSTLIAVPQSKSTSTKDTGFYILVRLWSGFHGSKARTILLTLARKVHLNVAEINIGSRQGIFDLVIRIAPGQPYYAIKRFLDILDSTCAFVEDVATIVCTEETFINE